MDSNQSKNKILIKLFFTMLYISAFTFGGGFVIVTLIKKKLTDEYKWIDEQEMLDIISLSQSTPGPIAINAAVIVGKKLGGIRGIIAAALGTALPPFLIITVISFFYNAFSENEFVKLLLKGMGAGVAAVVLDVVCSLSGKYFKNRKFFEILLIVLSFVLVFFLKINVIIIILAAVILGTLITLIKRRKAAEK